MTFSIYTHIFPGFPMSSILEMGCFQLAILSMISSRSPVLNVQVDAADAIIRVPLRRHAFRRDLSKFR